MDRPSTLYRRSRQSRALARFRSPGPWRGLTGLLLFDLAVLIGVWIVHQTEYLIEYGNRFNAVMADTPHRFYMEPAAGVLALAATIAGGICLLCLLSHSRQAQQAADRLSPRVAQRLTTLLAPISVSSVSRTACVLFLAQAGVYAVQENLESWFMGVRLPGTSVLFGAPHITVLPLHALVATILAIILTAGRARLRRAKHASRMAGALAALLSRADVLPPQLVPAHDFRPNLRFVAGSLGLRSPPLST
jgi:hypothetical protein